MVNLNFNNRSGTYPQFKDIKEATDEQIMEWVNTLPQPTNPEESNIFNGIFDQLHNRKGMIS